MTYAEVFTRDELSQLFKIIGGMIAMIDTKVPPTPATTGLIKIFSLIVNSMDQENLKESQLVMDRILSLINENGTSKNLMKMATDTLADQYREKFE
jgi:hypothetical protein